MARFILQVAVARDPRSITTASLKGGKIVMAMLQLVRALTGVNGNTGKKKYIQKFTGNYRSKANIWKSVLKSGCSHILQNVLKDSTKLFELCLDVHS